MKEIDIKEDHLLIYRDNNSGEFLRFEWHYADKKNKDDLMGAGIK